VPRSVNEWSYTSTPQYAFTARCSVYKKAQVQVDLYLVVVVVVIFPSYYKWI